MMRPTSRTAIQLLVLCCLLIGLVGVLTRESEDIRAATYQMVWDASQLDAIPDWQIVPGQDVADASDLAYASAICRPYRWDPARPHSVAALCLSPERRSAAHIPAVEERDEVIAWIDRPTATLISHTPSYWNSEPMRHVTIWDMATATQMIERASFTLPGGSMRVCDYDARSGTLLVQTSEGYNMGDGVSSQLIACSETGVVQWQRTLSPYTQVFKARAVPSTDKFAIVGRGLHPFVVRASVVETHFALHPRFATSTAPGPLQAAFVDVKPPHTIQPVPGSEGWSPFSLNPTGTALIGERLDQRTSAGELAYIPLTDPGGVRVITTPLITGVNWLSDGKVQLVAAAGPAFPLLTLYSTTCAFSADPSTWCVDWVDLPPSPPNMPIPVAEWFVDGGILSMFWNDPAWPFVVGRFVDTESPQPHAEFFKLDCCSDASTPALVLRNFTLVDNPIGLAQYF